MVTLNHCKYFKEPSHTVFSCFLWASQVLAVDLSTACHESNSNSCTNEGTTRVSGYTIIAVNSAHTSAVETAHELLYGPLLKLNNTTPYEVLETSTIQPIEVSATMFFLLPKCGV